MDAAAMTRPALSPTDPLSEVADRYAVAVTPAMERLIDPGDPQDPIARQFLPDVRELDETPEERADPIDDAVHSPVEGVVHRYRDRCLLKITHVCPVYCRFCFRREMVGPGAAEPITVEKLDAALAYIEAHPEIWEVILTGGDPFVLSPRRAKDITQRLAAIAHVQVIRWHTRVPVVDPARVTPDFVSALKCEKAVYVALHANHPREITPDARAAIARLVDAGIPMLSQTVLLKGVNDDVETLENLMRALVAARVKPYYLHHGDLAPGTSHFRTSIEHGQDLTEALRARASGLCQPSYVLDIPGGAAKAPLSRAAVRTTGAACEVCDHEGRWRAYPPEA
ncbi:MAG: lysine-2,3-aminomutase-like protein [Hyphomonadaceae bacterium]|nr:MAG: lysine 2 3-aminomutase [Caulobacteraceae bacterium]MBT9447235.1 lysine-2,3-aminomutase-like protein [Hyphomonadaceae bacterium]